MVTLQEMIEKTCEEVGEDVSFRDNYSGCGMYGKSSVSIVGGHRACMEIIGHVIKELADNLGSEQGDGELTMQNFGEHVDQLLHFQTDSMGYDIIFYWPDLAEE